MSTSGNTPSEHKGAARVGVYLCRCGGNISDHVDVDAVRERLAAVPGVAAARVNTFMCSDPGQQMIMEDLQSGLVDRVVVASCAPSLHETTFRAAIERAGANPYLYEHANIREQVSWVHHGEAATDKATLLVAAAAAKAAGLWPLEPIRVPARRHVTVVGGGAAGMRAALDLAGRGIPVALVEKSPFLGGGLARLSRVSPTGRSGEELVRELADAVLANPLIAVHSCAEVAGFSGYVGNFSLSVRRTPPDVLPDIGPSSLPEPGGYVPFAGVPAEAVPEAEETLALETGSVLLATGFSSYRPQSGEYGAGELPEVVTLPEFARLLGQGEGDKELAVNGRPVRSLALIHCVGSRQIPGIHEEREDGTLNEYCSRVCCTAALTAAVTVRERFPETRVYDLFRDIRTYGRGQEDIYTKAAQSGVVFMRFEAEEPPVVEKADGGGTPLRVRVRDTLTFGEELAVPVDLVVLATGMEPAPVGDLVEMMKLPVGADRFLLEVHPKLRPVELPTAGLLLAGTCQAPMDSGEACNTASAAAAKAAILLDRGEVSLNPFVATVDLARCVGTGACPGFCVDACLKEDALRMVEVEQDGTTVSRAQVEPALCMGCGACVAVCPKQAIEVSGWALSQYEAMVDAIVDDTVLGNTVLGAPESASESLPDPEEVSA
ncbi:Pyridine nucleotide-disulfide oxidoreductase, FAD/NAD(P)-binding domain containing protein [Desulfovibrio sp. X2]|uniref:CoB--CoM heterodisulfide reductase iron-sulfur subunit A family protein n=1 Tax=Desulfovibrio sp. X2 TaxID=941449 RepID=UPI0003589693|nr:4Fe-4S dicluster domain-containing protein [Desulfovibrio sp. X2]EPR41957.1 Pyridine nucleotide-disulfide oxidoreductase, FAD/NAD(P)-binding domain containing protein [Desulfovibrio sp. X2]